MQDAGRRRALLASVVLHLGAGALLAGGSLRAAGPGPSATLLVAVSEPAHGPAAAPGPREDAEPEEGLADDWAPRPDPSEPMPAPALAAPPLAPEWEPPPPEPGPEPVAPPPALPMVVANRRHPPARISPPVPARPTPAPPTAPAPTPPAAPPPPAPAPIAAAIPGERVRVLYAPDPRRFYPPQGRREGWQGETLLALEVDAEGTVAASRVLRSSGHPELDAAAQRYAAAMRFSPGAGGRSLRLPVRFELSGG